MKVLIVDDEPLVRRSLERAFARRGHQVFVAPDGREGLRLWRAEAPMDLVVLDVLMPEMTGPQVLSEIGPARTGLVTLISAHTSEYNADAAAKLGADHFVAKPFEDIFVFVEKLEKLSQNR